MKFVKILALLALLAATFAGGYLVRASKRNTPVAPARRVLFYVDGMNPAYRSDKPGVALDGMALQPVYADEPTGTTGEAKPVAVPSGTIKISPERQQLIGVKFSTVELAGDTRAIRAVGKVTFDETRVAHVHTRTDGWIEKVFVDFTGDTVTQGQRTSRPSSWATPLL
jgi:Cu(I)/Ag(I) efflux system membrane fusion protein